MDLFIEFALTIALSFVLSFFLAKLLSLSTACIDEHYFKRGVIDDLKFKAEKNKDYDWESETKLGFVSKIVEVDELGKSMQHKFGPQDFSKDRCGSPKILEDDARTFDSELSREVEVVDSTEEVIQESCNEHGDVCEGCECQENFVDESYVNEINGQIERDLIDEDVGVTKSEVFMCEADHESGDSVEDRLLAEEEEEDWEGIERSELERVFGAAVVYVGSKVNANKISSLGNDLKLQLYGLHKVAIEGPCHAPQPMAFKVSARSKWNAWRQLGNMNSEEAMKQYIGLLSRCIPGWMEDDFVEDHKQDFADAESPAKAVLDLKACLRNQQGALDEGNLGEQMFHVEGLDLGPNPSNKDK